MRSSMLAAVVPIGSILAGLALSVWRFRADDPIGGLAFALGGVLLMIVLAAWIPDSDRG